MRDVQQRDRRMASPAARHRFAVAALLLFTALLLGGASAAGWIANAVISLIALAALAWLVVTEGGSAILPADAAVRWFFVSYLAIVLLYLVPLPPPIWMSVPGREESRSVFAVARMTSPWQPLALIPDNAVASALSMIAPFATFVLVRSLPTSWRERLTTVIVVAAVLGLVLGALQLLDGPGSRLRFYRITTPGRAVAQFANPNHLAALLAVAIPLLAVRFRRQRVVVATTLTMLVVGIVVVGSVAGIGLAVVALGGFVAIAAGTCRTRPHYVVAIAAFAICIAAAIACLPLHAGAADMNVASRAEATMRSLAIARQLFPFGGGLGSFVELYRTAGDPMVTDNNYLNNVHDDFVEVVLELGVFGMALIALFIGWFAHRANVIWTGAAGDRTARAATLVILLLLLHSLVDYPLRTAALATVMAWACACLLDPPEVFSSRELSATDTAPDADLMRLAGL